MATASPSTENPSARPSAGRKLFVPFWRGRWQFSLRSLMTVMLCVATFSGVWQMAPQFAVFLAGTTFCGALCWRLRRSIRADRRWRWLGFACSALIFYVVSVGPALAVTQSRPAWDPLFDTVYWPLDWLCQKSMSCYALANWYLEYWRIPLD